MQLKWNASGHQDSLCQGTDFAPVPTVSTKYNMDPSFMLSNGNQARDAVTIPALPGATLSVPTTSDMCLGNNRWKGYFSASSFCPLSTPITMVDRSLEKDQQQMPLFLQIIICKPSSNGQFTFWFTAKSKACLTIWILSLPTVYLTISHFFCPTAWDSQNI